MPYKEFEAHGVSTGRHPGKNGHGIGARPSPPRMRARPQGRPLKIVQTPSRITIIGGLESDVIAHVQSV